MKKIGLDFGSVTLITNTLYEGVDVIRVNGGGGMGGSREDIMCRIVSEKTDIGFMIVQDIITNELIEINPRYIGTIRRTNVTKVYFEHNNPNFPSGKRTEWFTHKVNTKIELCKDNGERIKYPSVEQGERDESLNLKLVHTDNMNYL
jgi:hypothetical protein